MSIEIPMKREGQHLVPVDQVAAEMLAEVPTSTGVMVTVKVPRNLRQFRLAWALADLVSKSVDWLPDRESAMDWLKIKARHVRMIHDPLRGTTAIIPKSIAFQSLDQVGFRRVLDRMINVTTTDIIPGLEEGALRAELEAIVGIDAVEPEPVKPKRRRSPEPAARAPQPQRKGAEATGAEEKEPARSGDANPEEYIAKARAWIAQQTDHRAALEVLDSEPHVAWRKRCQLSEGQERMIRRELAQHFEGKTNAA